MITRFKSVIFILHILLLPVIAHASGQTKGLKHKPPILTTTAIIEIYDREEFRGIVLIERGKAPWGMAIPGGES